METLSLKITLSTAGVLLSILPLRRGQGESSHKILLFLQQSLNATIFAVKRKTCIFKASEVKASLSREGLLQYLVMG